MKKISIDKSFFKENREKLYKLMKPNSIAVLNSNDILPSNADGTMKFKQNNDLFYLSGITQEKTRLLLNPGSNDVNMREILFVLDYDLDTEIWEGSKLKTGEAEAISGIKTIMPLSKFNGVFRSLIWHADNIYLNSNEHDRAKIEINTMDDRFIKYCQKTFPLHNYFRLAPLLYNLRSVKSGIEIDLIKEACKLTANGFSRILKFVKPGVTEYEVEAELVHEYKRWGFDIADYEPIVASGINSCALHYDKNSETCKDGDILLIDAAAGYGPYNADVTRTIPVNGKFTARQKNIYNAVLRTFKSTVKEIKPGKSMNDIAMIARELIAKELVDLKLVKNDDVKNIENKSPVFKQYYPHDVSHYLGLDVHDVGLFSSPLKPGMILTCEPGIYIKEESLGIRIENDILVTEDGNIDLMDGVPIEAEDIENIMTA
ncbi:MAG TPA: aminopeptidase P family protein [Ignavibacteria bacterium]|nr:aminopeptidase P family protein [Ignavibacteria bacterium]